MLKDKEQKIKSAFGQLYGTVWFVERIEEDIFKILNYSWVSQIDPDLDYYYSNKYYLKLDFKTKKAELGFDALAPSASINKLLNWDVVIDKLIKIENDRRLNVLKDQMMNKYSYEIEKRVLKIRQALIEEYVQQEMKRKQLELL